MISYSGIYSPNNKNNQNLPQLDWYIFETAEIENRVITNAGYFPTFLYRTAIHVLLQWLNIPF